MPQQISNDFYAKLRNSDWNTFFSEHGTINKVNL